MKLQQIDLQPLQIPFQRSFKHAAAERSQTETVLAIAVEGPRKGHGEGCPRAYVSGETIESAMEFMNRVRSEILEIQTIEGLREWVSEHRSEIDHAPAAWCAIEMALLDLLAQEQECSTEALLGLPELEGVFSYTAVIGVSSPEAFEQILSQYLKLDFVDFKLKVSGELVADQNRLAEIQCRAPQARVRIDANNLWGDLDEAADYVLKLGDAVWAVEEPLSLRSPDELAKLGQRIYLPIILDESMLRLSELDNYAAVLENGIPNVRISKMGGLIRSLEFVERCVERKISVIVGAQVGETSLLTRAALPVARRASECLIAQEGAFGTSLLSHDIARPSLRFGPKGQLEFRPLKQSGWGLLVES